ncbi:hypothetical protein K443DRAFT_671020 [Laccaria amethystina LaAM-08-1]|uniref:Uncharacterized protein n=1 Tax=Laccaria amethystina LaAM-08-1 TaxID=1095629 RepID=A0A0C9YH44_9AGAR|nr:hypothetical protein K443DRAFT_671020 [Laccaria amethystina LaAM-08-1]
MPSATTFLRLFRLLDSTSTTLPPSTRPRQHPLKRLSHSSQQRLMMKTNPLFTSHSAFIPPVPPSLFNLQQPFQTTKLTLNDTPSPPPRNTRCHALNVPR